MPKNKKCVVGYKTGVNETGFVQGIVFSRLETCCEKFSQWFFLTGNTKADNFNASDAAPYGDRNGFNFVTRGDNLEMELRVTNPVYIGKIKFCLSCGAEVVVKKVESVTLKPKQKQVFDGYEGVDIVKM